MIVSALILCLLAAPLAAGAQEAGRVYRMGYLGTAPPTPATAPIWEAFVERIAAIIALVAEVAEPRELRAAEAWAG